MDNNTGENNIEEIIIDQDLNDNQLDIVGEAIDEFNQFYRIVYFDLIQNAPTFSIIFKI